MYDAVDDPYTYVNSTVLVNKLDLRDQDELDAYEAEISHARSGEPLPEEDLPAYSARRKRDRLQEQGMLKLLDRLGARPWEDEFYLPGEAFRIERIAYPDTISRKEFTEFACKRQGFRG